MPRWSAALPAAIATAALICTGCAGGGGNGVVAAAATKPSFAASSQRTAARIEPASSAAHIYAAQELNGRQLSDPTIHEYNEQGNALATSGSFPNLGYFHYPAYDSHNQSVYVLDAAQDGTSSVTVYDGQGVQKHTAGTFAHLPLNPATILFDSHNNLLYILTLSVPATRPSIKAYDEQGYEQKLSASFPNLGVFGYALMYDAHNGLIYYAGDSTGGAHSTPFVAAYDEEGSPQPLSGGFTVNNGPTGMTYDSHNGLIYVAGVNSPTSTFVVAFDEQGNAQTLSPGFPADMRASGSIGFDAHDGLLYATTFDSVEHFHHLDSTITAWDEQGNPQELSGRFNHPQVYIGDFVIAQ